MNPTLWYFDAPLVGRVDLPAYFTLLTIGFGLAMLITFRESKRIQLDPQLILDANLWMVVWGIIGGRVLHLIADGHVHDYVNLCVNPKLVAAIDPPVAWCALRPDGSDPCGPDFLCDAARHVCYPPQDCWAALEVWRGGLAYYGGFIFAIAFAAWYIRRHKMPLGRVSDLAAPGIACGLFFGRMGCFLNGCCYGKETHSRLGVVFPGGPGARFESLAYRAQLEAHHVTRAQHAIPVHPTQLYEAIACLAICVFLYYFVRPRKRHDGDVIAAFIFLYAVARSLIEFFRDDDRGVFFGGWVSTSQLLSIPLIALAAYIWLRPRRRGMAAAA